MGKSYIYMNVIFLILYGFQSFSGWSWEWLAQRQTGDAYKQLTGIALLLFILFQNTLLLARVYPPWKKHQKAFYQLHTQTGTFAIPLLYFHAAKLGYHYTFVLNLAYCVNVLIGVLAPRPLNIQSKRYGFYWMVSHVALSVFVSFFLLFHIFMTFFFN